VWVHGGPGGQSRVGYFALIQYLVNHGYAVLAVNNRGSSGYGKTFIKWMTATMAKKIFRIAFGVKNGC
jgi:dipeptidyl aminopeptidase/acylaminoacyl peptidase